LFKRWLLFVTEADGRSLVDQNGAVSSTNTRTPLDPTPDGWQDISFGYERDPETIGNVRSFSLPLGFFRSAAKMIRHEVYKRNIERRLFLLITKLYLEVDLIAGTYKRYYKTIHKGELDISSFKNEETKCTINLLEGGVSQQLKAYKSLVQEISMDDPEHIKIKWDGILLQETGNMVAVDDLEIAKSQYNVRFSLPIAHVSTDGQASGIAFLDQELEDVAGLSWDARLTLDNCCAKAGVFNTTTVNARFKGVLLFKCTQNDPAFGFRMRFVRSKQLIANQNDYQIVSTTGAIVAGGVYSQPFDITVPLQPGEKCFFEGIYFGGVTSAVDIKIEFLKDNKFTIAYENRYKTTYPKAFLPETINRKLVAGITGFEIDAQSNLIAQNNYLALTCVNAIRGLPTTKMKTNYQDFSKFWKVQRAAGMGVENGKIRIESYEHFLDDSDPIDLGEVKGMTDEPADDLMANTFKAGYEEQTYDNVNGKLEFNNTSKYKSPITRVVKEAEYISPFRADPFGLEILRLNLDGKTTTDNDSDNDVACVVLKDNPLSFIATGILGFDAGIKGLGVQGADILGELLEPGDRFTTDSLINPGPFTVDHIDIVSGGINIFTLELTQVEASNNVKFITRVYELRREPQDSITGVPSPETIFNYEISPRSIMNIQSSWINSMMYGFDGQDLVFQTTEKNADLKRIKNGVTVEEKANYTVVANRLFIPWWFNLETDVDASVLEKLALNPNRCFRWIWLGKTYKGFSWKIGISPDTMKEQAFKLLSTADNDLTKLIR
jgi:hypothetical protein